MCRCRWDIPSQGQSEAGVPVSPGGLDWRPFSLRQHWKVEGHPLRKPRFPRTENIAQSACYGIMPFPLLFLSNPTVLLSAPLSYCIPLCLVILSVTSLLSVARIFSVCLSVCSLLLSLSLLLLRQDLYLTYSSWPCSLGKPCVPDHSWLFPAIL